LISKVKQSSSSVYDLLNNNCPEKPSGMFVLPHFQGAGGTPDMEKRSRGMIYGLTMETGIFDIYRSVLEGINYEMLLNLETLKDFGIAPKKIFASGGGARSNAWLQIKADIFNREIIPVKEEEGGALGGAMMAAIALGCCKNEKEAVELFVKYKPGISPNEKNASIYQELYDKYKKLREAEMSFS